MAGKSSFRQPIRHGIDTGIAATTAIGNAPVVQKAGVSAGFSSSVQVARTPPNSEGGTVTTDIDSFVLDAFTAQTIVSGRTDAQLKIGTSGDATYFGAIGISGAGRYTITPSEASAGGLDKWYAVAADTSIFATVSAGGSGAAVDVTGQLLTKYVPR
jgi:hypothetical protein